MGESLCHWKYFGNFGAKTLQLVRNSYIISTWKNHKLFEKPFCSLPSKNTISKSY